MRKLCDCCEVKTVDLHSTTGQVLYVCLNENCQNYQVFVVEEKE